MSSFQQTQTIKLKMKHQCSVLEEQIFILTTFSHNYIVHTQKKNVINNKIKHEQNN